MNPHRTRYEGWKAYDEHAGTVRRFDKQDFRWVVLDIDDIPHEIVEKRRS